MIKFMWGMSIGMRIVLSVAIFYGTAIERERDRVIAECEQSLPRDQTCVMVPITAEVLK